MSVQPHRFRRRAFVAKETQKLAETNGKGVAVDRASESRPVFWNLPDLDPIDL